MNMTKDDLLAIRISLESEATDALEKLSMARGALQLLDHLLSEFYVTVTAESDDEESKDSSVVEE